MKAGSPALNAVETARAMLRAGRRDEAIAWFERARELDPDEPAAAVGLAQFRLAARDLAGAVRILRDASPRSPFDTRLAALRRDVALALHDLGLWEDAAPWLAEAAALEPWNLPVAAMARRLQRPSHVAPTIVDPLSGRTLERYACRESDTYVFVVEIVGTCNLRCPTCPVGNSASDGRAIGFMSRDLFERIIAKIKREAPTPSPQISLYNWGEPLLHPELPDFIAHLKREGLRVHLSSNLNIKRGLDEVIAADPDELKISLSGFSAETYRRPHERGDIERVKANMRRVAELRRKHGTRTRVWVGHHIYKSNRHEIEAVGRFCAELGFEHHPIEAFYMPLERLMDVVAGRDNPRDGGIVDDLLTHPTVRQQRAAHLVSGRYDCELRFNQTVINHDGSVALCCTVYDAGNMLGVGFLDEPLAAIEARKYRHPFCAECYAARLQYSPRELLLHAPQDQP